MRLSDSIETFIKALITDEEASVELKRNELAEYFGCAPSQINYVLATRFTLDDGYADNYTNLLPLLEQYDARATIFLITDMIGQPGYLTPEEILLLRNSGRVRFGLHTAAHADLTTLDLPALHTDMTRSIAAFTDLLGYAPVAMAYPYGKYTSAVMDACREYVSFAYTTENPRYKTDFGTMNIPRHLVARDTSMWVFRRMLRLN